MNEQLAEKATEALHLIITGAVATQEFVLEQAPDVVRQLLAWRFTASLIGFCASLLIPLAVIAASWTVARKMWRKFSGEEWDEARFAIGAVATAATVIASVVALCAAPACCDWLQIAIAPKVYLLEYAANLVK